MDEELDENGLPKSVTAGTNTTDEGGAQAGDQTGEQIAEAPPVQPTPPAQQQQQPQQQPPAPKVTTFGPQAQQLQQPVSQPKTTTTQPLTSYTRLQDYLRTNQPQAQGMGSAIQSQVNAQAAQGRQALGQAAQNFAQEVQAAGTTTPEARANELIQKVANLKAGESLTDAEFNELYDIAEKYGAFDEAAPVASDLMKQEQFDAGTGLLEAAQGNVAALGTTGGMMTLLNKLYNPNKDSYTGGEQLLDAILLGNVKPSAETVADLKSQYGADFVTEEQEAQLAEAERVRKEAQDQLVTDYQNIVDQVGSNNAPGLIGGMENVIKERIRIKNEQVAHINAMLDAVTKDPAKMKDLKASPEGREIIDHFHLTDAQVEAIKQTGGTNEGKSVFNTLYELNSQTGTTDTEYAELDALYKIAQKFGRTTERFVKPDQGDVGDYVDQEPVFDEARAQELIKANRTAASEAVRGLSDTAKNIKAYNYGFDSNLSVPDAAYDIYRKLLTGSWHPYKDGKEVDNILKVVNEKLLPQIQKAYTDRGLPAPSVEPTAEDIYNPDYGTLVDLGRLAVGEEYRIRSWPGDPGRGLGSYMSAPSNTGADGPGNQIGNLPYGPEWRAAFSAKDPKYYGEVVYAAWQMARMKKILKALGAWDDRLRIGPEWYEEYDRGDFKPPMPKENKWDYPGELVDQ